MATQPLASNRLCFDDFELDVRAGQLRRQGVRMRLRGQPLQVLEILLERAGDVVTREELQGQIWPADTFVDFDHSLHNAIARIREVLIDSAENPRYIETLPRRGYRFIGQVKEVAMEAPKALTPAAAVIEAGVAAGAAPLLQKKKGLRTRMLWPSLTLAFMATGIWFVPQTFHSHKVSAAVPQVHSIAVLPLTNLSGDPSQDYFADGMTEELITDLARVSSLRVVSRTS
ncbi:MAG: winged helix-turn-helix domain-containing protein, partial [Terracidiphilus sp.]